jgi:hypothetical protein
LDESQRHCDEGKKPEVYILHDSRYPILSKRQSLEDREEVCSYQVLGKRALNFFSSDGKFCISILVLREKYEINMLKVHRCIHAKSRFYCVLILKHFKSKNKPTNE